MKKIMLLFTLLILCSVKNVFAQNQYKLKLEKQDGIYFSRKGTNFNDDSYPYYLYRFGDIYAYCIEPGKHFSTYDYVGVDNMVDLPLSNEVKDKLELIGYYGRDYPGHDNIRYSMATQALIWELTGVDKVTYWTKQYEQGEEIDVTRERNEILSLVEKHRRLPKLPTHIYADTLHEVILEDSNKALDNFEVIGGGPYESYIENNKLHIMPHDPGVFTIYLQRKKYDDLNTIIFVGDAIHDTQKLARLRFSDLSEQEITLVTEGVHIIVQKKDENNNPLRMSGIRFKVKNLSTGEYLCDFNTCEYETDPDGYFATNGVDFGEYEIEEVENQIVKGYSWNSEKKRIMITEEDVRWENDRASYYETDYKNNSVSASLEIFKEGEKEIFDNNDITYQKNNLGNVYFDLYDSNNNFITTIITDSNGYAKVDNLKVGKYYVTETTVLDNYVSNPNKIEFEIKQDNSHQTHVNYQLTVNNILKKGTLDFQKTDFATSEGIANTIIEIYDNNNKLLLTKETDKNGKVKIPNLPIGKYYILEKEANYFYQKSNEKVMFEIKENGEIVKANMTNKKIVGNVIITKFGEVLKPFNNAIKYEMKVLPNIELYLYTSDNKLIDTLKTDSNGEIKKELELGKYYVVEKTRLDNYKDNLSKYFFEIKKDGNNGIDVKLNINNYLKKGGVEFSKEEKTTLFGIPNTIMEIYNDKNELLLTKTTDKNGKIIVNNLPLGKYYFKERKANYYYQYIDTIVPFEIKNDGEIVKTELTNEKIVGNLEIFKKGENYHFINNSIIYEKVNLHHIEFDLYQDDNQFVAHIITDKNGYAKYTNLPLGKYYLVEKTSLDNYIASDDKYYFEIKKDGNNGVDVKVTIDNYLKKGGLEFTKEDLTTSEGIPNTIIEIYTEDNKLILTKETDSNGKIIVNNLPVGRYYIIEKEANSMYQITNEKVIFEIKENGDIIKAKMTNEKIVVKVPKTNTKEDIIAHTLFGICFLFGIGRYWYERKETN